MQLQIGDKNYELKFGIKFIETLDRFYTKEIEGLEFGMGVELVGPTLNMGKPTAMRDVIKAGLAHLSSKPTDKTIEDYLYNLAGLETDEYDELLDALLEAMENEPFLKRMRKRMEANAKKHRAKLTKK